MKLFFEFLKRQNKNKNIYLIILSNASFWLLIIGSIIISNKINTDDADVPSTIQVEENNNQNYATFDLNVIQEDIQFKAYIKDDGITYLKDPDGIEKALNDIANIPLPKSLISIYFSDKQLTGDIGNWNLPESLTYIDLSNNNQLIGDISNWKLPTKLTHLDLSNNKFTGDIGKWEKLPQSLTYLNLSGNKNLKGSYAVMADDYEQSVPNLEYNFKHTDIKDGTYNSWYSFPSFNNNPIRFKEKNDE